MNASCLDEKGRFKSCPYRVYTDEHTLCVTTTVAGVGKTIAL